MKTEISFIREVSKLNNILNVCLRRRGGCTGLTKSGAEKRKWTSGESQVNSIHNVSFIISFIIIYHATHTVHAHAGAIRKIMCSLFACTSDNPLSKARELVSITHAKPIKYP